MNIDDLNIYKKFVSKYTANKKKALDGLNIMKNIFINPKYYLIVNGPSWENAETNSVNLGGHLVTINNLAENDFLVKSFTDELSESEGLYIGLKKDYVNRYGSQMDWYWVNGELLATIGLPLFG